MGPSQTVTPSRTVTRGRWPGTAQGRPGRYETPSTVGGPMFKQELAPFAGSLTASALIALLPLIAIFVLLGVLRLKAHWAGLAALGVAVVVAITAFQMPFQ